MNTQKVSNKIRHFFHVVSNVRPIVWICLYIALMPVFALIYHWLPDGQFRIPDGAGVDYGSWLYYSIVTITTLGFGDYTPAMGWAQAVTAIEVMCGLTILGFFLNAVGSMKSEIDVESEIEKQRALHNAQERDKLLKSLPMVIHNLNLYQEHCKEASHRGLVKVAARTAFCLDSLQNRVDLTLWPQLLEDCFSFVAEYQLYTFTEAPTVKEEGADREMTIDDFIQRTSALARSIETELTQISSQPDATRTA